LRTVMLRKLYFSGSAMIQVSVAGKVFPSIFRCGFQE
jgi:hypothetical protein